MILLASAWRRLSCQCQQASLHASKFPGENRSPQVESVLRLEFERLREHPDGSVGGAQPRIAVPLQDLEEDAIYLM